MPRLCLLALLIWGCNDDSQSGRDGPGVTVDAPAGGVDASPGAVDAPTGGGDASTLGELCVTSAIDGGPGACTGGEACCTAAAPYICRLPSDCPGGGGYVPCSHGSDCQGSVCCQLPQMTFCTKQNACASYGGTILP